MHNIANFFWMASFICVLPLAGCNRLGTSSSQPQTADRAEHAPHGDHALHAEHGPNGGELMVIDGGRFHAEVIVDEKAGRTTVYMLDKTAENTISVLSQQPTMHLDIGGSDRTFTLAAAPTDDDDEGTTTRFELDDAQLAVALASQSSQDAKLTVTIQGKPQDGRFESHDHSGHDHHGHDHHEHDHHAESDAAEQVLIWHGDPRPLADHQIRLGQYGLVVQAGRSLRPAVTVQHDDQPVGDAQVFCSLRAADGATVLAEEQVAALQPAADDQPACYVSDHLAVPSDAAQVIIRYRIVLPGTGEAQSFDIRVQTEQP